MTPLARGAIVPLMSATLGEGTLFARRYRVVRCIAAGAMGVVYEAVHLETDRRRALKVMHPHLFQSDEMRERFKREARIAAHVESEHIVDVSDAGVDEATGMPFLVMELLRGEEVGERLKRIGRFPSAEVLGYLQQIAPALDRTHAASIVHRDLKPANLFLTQREDGSPRIKILDFGVAKLVAEGSTAAGATRSLGTPLYMAPEQFRTGTKLTGAADIFALGMIAYTLLVGEPYWSPEASSAADVIAFALAAARGPQESAERRAAAHGVALPPGFDAWFRRATAVEPTARFRTATEAVLGLNEVFGGSMAGIGLAETAPIPPTGPSPHPSSLNLLERAATSTEAAVSAAPAPPRHSAAVAVAAVLGVLALGALGVGTWWVVQSRIEATPVSAASTEADRPAGPDPAQPPAAPTPAAPPTVEIAPVAAPVLPQSSEPAPPAATAGASPAAPANSGRAVPVNAGGREETLPPRAGSTATMKAGSAPASPARPPTAAPASAPSIPRDIFGQD